MWRRRLVQPRLGATRPGDFGAPTANAASLATTTRRGAHDRRRQHGQGSATRWARPTTAWARTSRSTPRPPTRSSCACSTRRRTGRYRATGRPDRGRRLHLARLPARHRPRPALRLPRARRPTTRRPGSAAIRPSCCSTPTPRRSRARSGGASRSSATASASDTSQTDSDSAPSVPRCVVANPYFDWGNDRQPRIPYHQSVIYEAHVRGLTMLHPACRRSSAARYAGLAHPAVIEHLRGPRRHRCRAHAGAPVRQRRLPRRTRPVQLLGLQHHRVLRAAQRLLRGGQLGEQVPEFKSMVRALHEAGPRGDPRRRLQPHRRGQPPRPDAVVPRHRQRQLLPADSGPRTAATTSTPPAPATAC